MTTTQIIPRHTIVVCHECSYPRIIRKVEYSICPFCLAEKSELDELIDARIVKVGPLKEGFFASLQDR